MADPVRGKKKREAEFVWKTWKIVETKWTGVGADLEDARQVAEALRQLISDPDIYRAAKLLIDQHGDGAAERAEQRASELWDAGGAEAAAVCRQTLRAVDELTRAWRDDEPVN